MQVKDPVCGMTVENTAALKSTYQGTTYYFCSEQCQKTFDANPARYATPAGAEAGR
ncbi:MAG: YHS domain-containing protein [Gemmatimonadales bacterium]